MYSGRGVAAVLRYHQNKTHPHHLDVRVDPLQNNAVLSADEFASGTADALQTLNGRSSAGRKTAIHATWKILTFPPESWLRGEECDWFADRIVEGLESGQALAWCWHHNRLTGSSDLNIVEANFFGKPAEARSRRRRDRNEWLELCRMSDDFADELNARREATNEAKIITMAAAKSANGKGGRELELATALARLPLPVKLNDLEQAIVKLGWTVTRLNHEKDYVSVIPPNTPSSSKKKITKPRRLRISSLMEAAAKTRMRRKEKTQDPSDVSREPS